MSFSPSKKPKTSRQRIQDNLFQGLPNKSQQTSNSAICNIIDLINENNLSIYYENNSKNADLNFKHNVDKLNLKFYLETEKILSVPNPNLTEQLEHQNKLFLILFKQINLYIKEIERLNTLLLDKPQNPESIRKRMEIISKQKDDFETKELIIQSLKHSVESLEQKLLKSILSENTLRAENEKLKQELETYKNQNENKQSSLTQQHNQVRITKTRTYSSDHQHTNISVNSPVSSVNNSIKINDLELNCCNNNVNNNNYKDIKLTSHKINDRSPLTHKNSNKKLLNFNLSNKSVGKGIGNVFKEGNSSHHSKQQLKIIKAVKNKFSMLNKNKSPNTIGGSVVTSNVNVNNILHSCSKVNSCNNSNNDSNNKCGIIYSDNNNSNSNNPNGRINGYNLKQNFYTHNKRKTNKNLSPSNSSSLSLNNGKGNSLSNGNTNINNIITKTNNYMTERNMDRVEKEGERIGKKFNKNDNDSNYQYNYTQFGHSSLLGRTLSNGGVYG